MLFITETDLILRADTNSDVTSVTNRSPLEYLLEPVSLEQGLTFRSLLWHIVQQKDFWKTLTKVDVLPFWNEANAAASSSRRLPTDKVSLELSRLSSSSEYRHNQLLTLNLQWQINVRCSSGGTEVISLIPVWEYADLPIQIQTICGVPLETWSEYMERVQEPSEEPMLVLFMNCSAPTYLELVVTVLQELSIAGLPEQREALRDYLIQSWRL